MSVAVVTAFAAQLFGTGVFGRHRAKFCHGVRAFGFRFGRENLAMPKSSSFGVPSLLTRMFDGFKSR